MATMPAGMLGGLALFKPQPPSPRFLGVLPEGDSCSETNQAWQLDGRSSRHTARGKPEWRVGVVGPERPSALRAVDFVER